MIRHLSDYFPDAPNIEFNDIKTNASEIQPHDLFVCFQDEYVDRHEYLPQASLANAAGAIISNDVHTPLPTYRVNNPREILVELLQKAYPFDGLKLIGVTGTDGKTTISTILGSFLNHLSSAGVIGTNGAFSPHYEEATRTTTPSIENLYRILHTFHSKGDHYAVMEAGSEGLYIGRTEGLKYDIAIFSNLTSEHMNTHKTMENYFNAKAILFQQTKPSGYAIINQDDPYANAFKAQTKATILTYGQDSTCDFRISDITVNDNDTSFVLHHNGESTPLKTNLLGEFNTYNLAATFCAMHACNYDYRKVFPLLSNLHISGRLNRIECGQPFKVLVDYAHTPNGYLSLFKFIKTLKMNRLIVVAASAGGRDQEKRPTMGKILSDEADYVFITSEDPRFENPMDIAKMMIEKVNKPNVEIILDRALAIQRAIHSAQHGDCVLVLGKGEEAYQIIMNKRFPFNDIEQSKAAILSHPLMKIRK